MAGPHFRRCAWGTLRADVIASESAELLREDKNAVVYKWELADNACEVVYKFADSYKRNDRDSCDVLNDLLKNIVNGNDVALYTEQRLREGAYVFPAAYVDQQVATFERLFPALLAKYGPPAEHGHGCRPPEAPGSPKRLLGLPTSSDLMMLSVSVDQLGYWARWRLPESAIHLKVTQHSGPPDVPMAHLSLMYSRRSAGSDEPSGAPEPLSSADLESI